MEMRLCWVTCATREEAHRIGLAAVEAGLAGCANLLPAGTSIYRWQGAVVSAEETVLVLKTRAELVPALTGLVKERHSDTVPCVVALPIVAGDPDYLRWLAESTGTDRICNSE